MRRVMYLSERMHRNAEACGRAQVHGSIIIGMGMQRSSGARGRMSLTGQVSCLVAVCVWLTSLEYAGLMWQHMID